MNIGVMSDTHGNRKLMHRVADQMMQDAGVTLIIHLGDNFEDAEELRDYGHAVHMVPGLWCPEYRNNRVAKTTLGTFDGVTIACAHAENDLQDKAQQAEVVLVGHTHCGKLEKRGDTLWMNPGHLKAPTSRNQPPTYGVLWLSEDGIRATLHNINGSIRDELICARSRCSQ